MNLGKAIKLCRTQRGLNQQQLADLVGLSVSYLSLIEQNKRDPSFSVVEKLAVGLGIPVSILIFVAAEKNDLAGIDPELAEKLSYTALTFLNELKSTQQTLL